MRQLAERMRVLGISQRDVADFLTKYKDTPVSYSSVMRHDGHFDRDAVLKSAFGEMTVDIPVMENGEVSITKIAKYKLAKFWETQKETIPDSREAREWGKLLLDAAKTGNEAERTDMLRQLFTGAAPKQLPAPSIEGEFEALN